MKYNKSNIFAQIISGKLPCNKVYEDDIVLAFHDKYPVAPIHVLVVPKGEYTCYADFVTNASSETIIAFFKAVCNIATQLGLHDNGYRIVTNRGEDADQTVQHFHMHILGGGALGPMLSVKKT